MEVEKMKKKKYFVGVSRFVINKYGTPIMFSTNAVNEHQGRKALQRAMNKKRGCVPEAIVPGMEITEVEVSKISSLSY